MNSKNSDLMQWFVDICSAAPVEMMIPENAHKIIKLIETNPVGDEVQPAPQE